MDTWMFSNKVLLNLLEDMHDIGYSGLKSKQQPNGSVLYQVVLQSPLPLAKNIFYMVAWLVKEVDGLRGDREVYRERTDIVIHCAITDKPDDANLNRRTICLLSEGRFYGMTEAIYMDLAQTLSAFIEKISIENITFQLNSEAEEDQKLTVSEFISTVDDIHNVVKKAYMDFIDVDSLEFSIRTKEMKTRFEVIGLPMDLSIV
jgi:hypothetical protein